MMETQYAQEIQAGKVGAIRRTRPRFKGYPGDGAIGKAIRRADVRETSEEKQDERAKKVTRQKDFRLITFGDFRRATYIEVLKHQMEYRFTLLPQKARNNVTISDFQEYVGDRNTLYYFAIA